MHRIRIWGSVGLLWLTISGQGWAQHFGELESVETPWREAQALRGGLEAGEDRPAAILRLAVLELSMGRPEKAHELLEADTGASWPPEVIDPLMGEVAYQQERFELAADLFDRASRWSKGAARGILLVRSAEAYERAGRDDDAVARYRAAAGELPELEGWIAIREARLTPDTARALDLLVKAPPAGKKLSSSARASVLLAAGDSASAIAALTEAGFPAGAAEVAFALGDSVRSRALTYQSLRDRDTTAVKAGLRLVEDAFPPRTASEYANLARALRRVGSTAAALDAAKNAATMDSGATDFLVYWADLLELAGDRVGALAAYGRAARQLGEDGESAAFKRARLLLRMRQTREAVAALSAFADSFPQSPSASVALYLAATGLRRLGRVADSDSVTSLVSERWPRSYYASAARFSLARRYLQRGDTLGAVGWYSAEVELGGRERFAAQYEIAMLTADSLERRGLLAILARADSLGYFGTIARQEAQLAPLDIATPVRRPPNRRVVEVFEVLDLLDEAHLLTEVAALVEDIMADRPRPPAELLDYAEGLIERGFMSEGIRLGWRATRAYTLNHPRVLRVIFPWPFRELIEDEAARQALDPYLLAALIRQESAFRPSVVSHAGAYGLMQLMPPTARQLARRLGIEWDRRLLVVADANLHLGAVHFSNLLKRFDGAVEPALAAYNAGATPVRRWLRNTDPGDPVGFIASVSYPETQGYLRAVTRNRALYRALYPPREATGNGTP